MVEAVVTGRYVHSNQMHEPELVAILVAMMPMKTKRLE